ncbi:Putative uncharacterized protein [Thermotoga neapolitana DSM 4359]|uniref:Uncharacterized protein n=1 Tax=Thermotoga neapolitana (strain ATCC 49049 / DSM 4359 / NBRC 107923 / NS-E) TaxID=309803 RepID=B9K960_THENN|nr:Putative uncharacterized protein [Thermotoga neapolitana DSM 4359]
MDSKIPVTTPTRFISSPLDELFPVHSAVDPISAQKFFVPSFFFDETIVENVYPVGILQDLQSVRYHDDRFSLHAVPYRAYYLFFCFWIHGGETVIEDVNLEISDQCSGYRDPLPLSTRKGHSAFTNDGVEFLWKTHDVFIDSREFRHPLDLFLVHVFHTNGYVVSYRVGKQKRFLRDQGEDSSQILRGNVVYIHSVYEYLSPFHRIQFHEKLCDRCLSASHTSNDADHLSSLHLHVDVLQDGSIGSGVPVGQISYDHTFEVIYFNWSFRLFHFRLGGEDRVHATHGCPSSLEQVHHEAVGHHGPYQHSQVGVEGDEISKRDLLVYDCSSSIEKRKKERGRGNQGDERTKHTGNLYRPEGIPEVDVCLFFEYPERYVLRGKALHDSNTVYRLFGEAREFRKRTLDVCHPPVYQPSKTHGSWNEKKERGETDPCELPSDVSYHENEHHQDHDEGVEKQNGPLSEYSPQKAQIVGESCHQLSASHPVEETGSEAEHLGEHPVHGLKEEIPGSATEEIPPEKPSKEHSGCGRHDPADHYLQFCKVHGLGVQTVDDLSNDTRNVDLQKVYHHQCQKSQKVLVPVPLQKINEN